jgi:2'-5' RNA ligase
MSDADAPECLRLFVSIQIPERIKEKLAAAQAELRCMLPERGVAWIKPEQFHLTLKFLGQVAAQRLTALSLQLGKTCLRSAPLHLTAARVDAFPDLRFPRVIWVGLNDRAGRLAQLQEAIEAASREFCGKSAADKFTGHSTLGRAKCLNRRDTQVLGDWLARQAERSFGEWTATEIQLMRSELSSAGARHTCVERIPLAGLTPTAPHE